MSNRINTRNPDFIKGINFPLQTYAFSGTQFGSSLEIKDGKRPTDSSPMLITSQPPGASAKNDTSWRLTFGASHDAMFTLFNGKFFNDTSLFQIPLNLGGIYRDSIGTGDQNTYEPVVIDGNTIQQIHYVVSKQTAKEAREAETFGVDLDDVRGIGMRIPMMAGGWGRTIGMRPTDPKPTEDEFGRKNDEEHKLARETWKYGPVDLRWDDRRGVWGAWNDLIADHRGQNLGTLVFDTNPDEECGFPFLKGKLEDVWKVVIDSELAPDGTGSDTQKSGSVATHLEHLWAEQHDDVWFYGSLNNAFTVHRNGPTTGKCGDETYKNSFIEILTGVYFHLDDTLHGPICFTSSDIEDSDLVGCMKFDGSQWVPAVSFNACAQVGFELAVLFKNDQILADKIIEVCKFLLDCLGKVKGKIDPTKTGQAGEKSQEASEASEGAEDALDGLPSGSGPGGEYAGGDALSNAPGAPKLTASEAKALNDSIPAASEAFQNAKEKQAQAGQDAIAAGQAQDVANESANKLGEITAAADDAQAAADAANIDLASAPNDPSRIEAAQKANAENKAAQEAKQSAIESFNKANEAAEAAADKASDSHAKAKEATADAKEKSQQVIEDAGTDEDGNSKLPEDLIDAMDKANRANEEADTARENAGIGDDLADEEPTVEDKIDDAKKELSDKIDGLACEKIEDLIALGDAMGQALQKALVDMSDAVNTALSDTVDSINNTLGTTIGFDTETGTGGVEHTPVGIPPACPIEAVGSGKVVPGIPQELTDGGTVPPDGTGGTGGGATRERNKPSGGTTEAPPPGGGDGGVPPDTPPVPPPPPPTCPIITIKDPCGGYSTHGPCPGGKGSGTPRGTSRPGEGDPGTPGGAPTGGVDGDGQVFPKPEGGIIGLGGQNNPIDLGGGLGLPL